jgi:5-methylcytosine-specific restriction endonuclease McrA
MYSTPEWAQLRDNQLARDPLCCRCSTDVRPVAATVANHKIPHKGDRKLFRDPNNLESVCAPCHDGPIQREERLGFSTQVDPGGWPIDPRHPSNRST